MNAQNSERIPAAPLPFDNLFARELPDAGLSWQPQAVPEPAMLFFNRELALSLGLDEQVLGSDQALRWWAGCELAPGAAPMAQAYSGHQFGGFSPLLGDGRALLLGDFVAPGGECAGQRFDVALKGSGPTPFARRGDGKAAVGPMLREVLMGEALHAVGIPTTRALAVAGTGEWVRRERPLPGAVLTRVAASHIRVGSFQYAASRGEHALLRRLWLHALQRHDPQLGAQAPPHAHAPEDDTLLQWFEAVQERQARLMAQWMSLGFVHGVMNTDNMAISGQTIDFGPCALMETFDPTAVFSSIDHQGRYAYGRQPSIAQWNLARLAEALLPLFGAGPEAAAERLSEVLQRFPASYQRHWRALMAPRFGLALDQTLADEELDALVNGFLQQLHEAGADYHWGLRHLAGLAASAGATAHSPTPEPSHPLLPPQAAWRAWHAQWQAALQRQGLPPAEQAQRMRGAHPLVLPRNQVVEAALAAAQFEGDLKPFDTLVQALRHPWRPEPLSDAQAQAPLLQPSACGFMQGHQTFCGT
jgi:uncharacterized protein YdiU (UPF0061 family)